MNTKKENSVDNDESGWVIEDAASPAHTPLYWTGRAGGVTGWTGNHIEAIRFARKVDAESFVSWVGWIPASVRIAEHAWTPARNAAP